MDSLQTAMISLLWEQPFYGHLLLQARCVKAETLGFPAAVRVADGRIELLWNPLRMEAFRREQVIAILEHECLHLVLMHLRRRGERSAIVDLGGQVLYLWNVAADLAVNTLIRRRLPDGALLPKLFDLPDEWSAERYYDALLERRGPDWELYPIPGAGLPGLLDDHSLWSEDECGDEDLDRETIRQAVDDALSRARGKLPPGLAREQVQDLLRPAEIPWSLLLRRYAGTAARVGFVRTIKRPNRRFGEEQKGRRVQRTLRIVAAIDTSGSIGPTELSMFFAELRQLSLAYGRPIRVIEADDEVRHTYMLTRGRPHPRVHGRGGTDFAPVFRHIEVTREPVDLLIYLTDLVGTFPPAAPHYHVAWIVAPGGYPWIAPFGRTIRMTRPPRRRPECEQACAMIPLSHGGDDATRAGTGAGETDC
ncbi:MAG: hypothetical protein FJ109_10380 [Deltaproteobacteria bacterium]|nr:hypothetical protein [Deltaproteobacteria bacterium]